MVDDIEKRSLSDAGRDLEANSALVHDATTTDALSANTAVTPDPDLVDWDGEDDPEKPVNWTLKKKWANGGLLAAMTFIT